MPDLHAGRRARLAAVLAGADAPAALVTSLVNTRWLTGLASSNAAVLVTAGGRAVLATDGRYATQAGEQAPDVELVVARPVARALVERAAADGLRRLAFEEHVVTVEQHRDLTSVGPVLVPLGRTVEGLRTTKDDEELALLRRACAIADEALSGLVPTLRPGRTERDVARDLEARMTALGADGPSFPTIVGTGPHSAEPHHRPTDRPLAAGDLLVIDSGAAYAGYHSDATRTFVLGPPADWQRDLHALVRAAQAAGRAALAPGADVQAVDAAARAVIEDAGHGEHFPHGLGHGVGLEIHEAPLLARTGTGRLADRVPVTVEPGVYLPGRGGVRIEDTLVVRDGEPDLLTTTTKDLLVL